MIGLGGDVNCLRTTDGRRLVTKAHIVQLKNVKPQRNKKMLGTKSKMASSNQVQFNN